MDKDYFNVLFELNHKGTTIANKIVKYEIGTPEDKIEKDYRVFLDQANSNIDSGWRYYG